MSDVLIDQDTMEDIGDAIREKLGASDTYLPASMPAAIRSISGGGGGGSAKYSETVLWSGTLKTVNATASLSESIYNFDQIKILWTPHKTSDNIYHSFTTIPVSDVIINQTAQFLIPVDWAGTQYTAYISCKFSDNQTLTLEEVSNGTNTDIRILKIIGIKWETMQTALIYSEEEREVGVWTDGKPLYQKTVNMGTLAAQNYKTVLFSDVGISNLEHVAYIDIVINDTHNVNFNRPDNVNTEFYSQLTATGIFLRTYSTAITRAIATIQYTKTTDTAGSGIWTTTGEYAHHYSTDEHIVGTWVDGSTLYEKTIVINNPASGGDWVEYDIGVPNLNKVIKQEGTWDRDVGSSGIWTYDLNAVNELSWNNNYIVNARIRNGTKKLAVYVGSQYSCPQLRFTFQYTKTT